MEEQYAVTLVSAHHQIVWDAWCKAREKSASNDLVAILYCREGGVRAVIRPRIALLEELYHVRSSLPHVLFQPASQADPVVAHGGAIWVIVLRKGQGGACLRLTGARMGAS